MHIDQGRGRRLKKTRRNTAAWALAIGVLGLAFPATSLGAARRPVQPASTVTPPREAAALERTVLRLGSGYGTRGGSPAVRALQRRLARSGYPAGAIDGLYGPGTRDAVLAFQTSHGLNVDGVAGPQTWAALTASALVLGPGAGNHPGGSGLVRSLQRRLALAGDAPGPIDGRFGVRTETALRRFQSTHGLRVDGIAGTRTFALLPRLSGPAGPARPASASARRSPGFRPPAANPTFVPSGSSSGPAHAQRPGHAAPRTPHGAAHRPGSGTLPWLIAVGGLMLALAALLAAGLDTAWRRGHRSTRPDARFGCGSTTGDAVPVGVRTEHASANGANGRDGVIASPLPDAQTGRTNGYHATTDAGAGDRFGEEKRSAPAGEPEHDAKAPDGIAAFNLGLLLEAEGSTADAQAAYARADEHGHGAAAANLGRLLEEQGALAQAEAAYRRADQRGDAVGAFNLAVRLEDRCALEEAISAYRRALDRGYDPAAVNLGVLLETQGAVADAEDAYRRADEGGDASAAFNLGELLEERGALSDAEEAYRRAERRGDDEVANMARAALLDLAERVQEAGAGRRAPARHG